MLVSPTAHGCGNENCTVGRLGAVVSHSTVVGSADELTSNTGAHVGGWCWWCFLGRCIALGSW